VATCPGSLIVDANGTVAGCTLDDDADGCAFPAPYPRPTFPIFSFSTVDSVGLSVGSRVWVPDVAGSINRGDH